jgi:hypothetical protein
MELIPIAAFSSPPILADLVKHIRCYGADLPYDSQLSIAVAFVAKEWKHLFRIPHDTKLLLELGQKEDRGGLESMTRYFNECYQVLYQVEACRPSLC